MSEATKAKEPDTEKRKRMRSPAYPYVNLETALKRAKEFYDKEQRNAAPLRIAAKHWNYEEKSSGAAQTAAALISFGLMQDEGTGEKRKLKLTETALRIVLDSRPNSEERLQAIRIAALTPKIHRMIWKKWGASLPSDDNLKHALMLDWKPPFNPAAVGGFIKEYKDTMLFAKPDSSANVPVGISDPKEEEEEDTDSEEGNEYTPKIGDYIQWDHNGVLEFADPKRIRDISPDGEYVFVDGQYAGILASQVILEKPPAIKPPVVPPPITPALSKTHMQEFVVPLSDGSRAVFQWPSALTKEDVDDLRDSLKILDRKISRSQAKTKTEEATQ